MTPFGLRARLRRQLAKVRRVPTKALERFHRSSLPTPLATLAGQVRAEGLTYLSPAKLDKLGQAVLDIERQGIDGAILEAGCALGGSAILLGTAKSITRPLRVYDVFGMIPPPSEKDDADVHARYEVIASGKSRGLKGQRYYGYETDLYQRVQRHFDTHGLDRDAQHIEMIAGMVEDTLVVDGPVALAHVDVDWYQPVMTCLERVAPHLAVGGAIVLDDYFDWSGCRKATDDFLRRTSIPFAKDASGGSLLLRRLEG